MSRVISLTCAVLLCCTWICAQENPRVTVFGGYAYSRLTYSNAPSVASGDNGWNGAVNFKLHQQLGIAADFGGTYSSNPGQP